MFSPINRSHKFYFSEIFPENRGSWVYQLLFPSFSKNNYWLNCLIKGLSIIWLILFRVYLLKKMCLLIIKMICFYFMLLQIFKEKRLSILIKWIMKRSYLCEIIRIPSIKIKTVLREPIKAISQKYTMFFWLSQLINDYPQ